MLTGTLIYGFVNSVILIVVALGFNLTFGISGVANFAYGALYITAGFSSWLGLHKLGLPFIPAALGAIALTSVLAGLMYRFIVLRVRGLTVSEVIATFGVGLAILEFFRHLGFIGFEYSLPQLIDESVQIADVFIDAQRLVIVGAAVLMSAFLWFFTRWTKTGRAFRAIAQDEHTAMTLGVNTERVATVSVAFGAAYAAVAALVILPLGTVSVDEGYHVLIDALAVCIVGGLGSTLGVVVAGFLIGYAQTVTAFYLETHWMMIVSLVAILVILVLKPSGLFGSFKELEERI